MKQLFFIAAILAFHSLKAQDIRPANFQVVSFSGNNHSIKVTIRTGKPVQNVRVYYELHTNNAIDNPACQVAKVEHFNFFQRLFRQKTVTISFDGVSFRPGLSFSNVTKAVVLTDPKLEISESNENNNNASVAVGG